MEKLNKPQYSEWSKFYEFDSTKWVAEPKLDGERFTLANSDGNLELIKNGTDRTIQFPELKNVELPDNTILDGELCILEPNSVECADFNKILKRSVVNPLMIKLMAGKYPATFVAFDVTQYEDKDVTNLSYDMRRAILKTINEQPGLKIIPSYNLQDVSYEYLQQHNMEGLVLKAKSSTYYHTWYKFKNFAEGDFKVIKINTSDAKKISSLSLADDSGFEVGSVNYINYPQTDEMENKLLGMTAVVKYMKTKSNHLRFPVLKELRVSQ